MYSDWSPALEKRCKKLKNYKAVLYNCSAFVGLGVGPDGDLGVLTAAKVGVVLPWHAVPAVLHALPCCDRMRGHRVSPRYLPHGPALSGLCLLCRA